MDAEMSRDEGRDTLSESIGPPPRRAERTGKGIAFAVTTAVITVIAVLYASFIAYESTRQIEVRNALRTGASQTEGQINGLPNPFHALKFYVDYTFVADSQTYTGEAIVPLELVHTLKPGSGLPISYLREKPAVNHPADWEWSAVSEFDAFGVVVVLAGVGCILFIRPQMRFERKLALEGEAATGTITRCKQTGRGGEFITLSYEFRTRDGARVQGRGEFGVPQETGARILILYLPGRPSQNAPYPLSTWRIAKR